MAHHRLVLVVLAALLAVAALSACGESAEPSDFAGTWHETGQDPARVMEIRCVDGALFEVVYLRFYPSRAEFRLDDGKLTYSAVTPEMTDVITCDAGSETLTITSGSTGDSYTLTRWEP
jgi:hypothetical protein